MAYYDEEDIAAQALASSEADKLNFVAARDRWRALKQRDISWPPIEQNEDEVWIMTGPDYPDEIWDIYDALNRLIPRARRYYRFFPKRPGDRLVGTPFDWSINHLPSGKVRRRDHRDSSPARCV